MSPVVCVCAVHCRSTWIIDPRLASRVGGWVMDGWMDECVGGWEVGQGALKAGRRSQSGKLLPDARKSRRERHSSGLRPTRPSQREARPLTPAPLLSWASLGTVDGSEDVNAGFERSLEVATKYRR